MQEVKKGQRGSNRAILLIEIDEAIVDMSKTASEAPKRHMALTAMDEPKCKKSSSESDAPRRA